MPKSEHDFDIEGGVIKFKDELKPFCAWVGGRPVTSSQRYKQRSRYQAWISCVQNEVEAERVRVTWEPACRYAVTLQFRFRKRRYQSQEGDLDNYVKPVLDGLGKGFDVDDRNFRTLLIRHQYVKSDEEEGVCIFVSSTGKGPEDTRATHQSGNEDPR